MAATQSERRKFFRVEVSAPARFRLIDEKSSKPLTKWINGSTADVSLGGVKIIAPMQDSEVDMLINQYIRIELTCTLPGTPQPFSATASIAYFLRGAAGSKATTVTFGVSFVTIKASAEDIIGEFIRQHINDPA